LTVARRAPVWSHTGFNSGSPTGPSAATVSLGAVVSLGVVLSAIAVLYTGQLWIDPLPVADVSRYRKQASELADKAGFDH
jgi:hypothetical protein